MNLLPNKVNPSLFMLLGLFLLFTGCKESPQACISIDATLVDQNFPVAFGNCSLFQQAGYDWDFGDGSTSSVVSPIHKFSAQGEYLVSLTSKGDRSDQDDVISEIIRVGKRTLATINITALPADDNGTAWDASDNPDIVVLLENDATSTVEYTSAIQTDHSLPGIITLNEDALSLDLKAVSYNVIVADDDAGSLDTMATFSINLDTYEPSENKTMSFSNNNTTMTISYSLD